MNRYIKDGLTQADYATHRPIVLVGAIGEYLDLLFLSIPYLPFPFPLSPTSLSNGQKSAETLLHRTVKLQHTLLETVE